MMKTEYERTVSTKLFYSLRVWKKKEKLDAYKQIYDEQTMMSVKRCVVLIYAYNGSLLQHKASSSTSHS